MSFKYERQSPVEDNYEEALPAMRDRWNKITPEQKNIIRFYLLGLKREEVALKLKLFSRTVDAHLNNAYKILGLSLGKAGNKIKLNWLWSEFEDKIIRSEQAEEDTLS